MHELRQTLCEDELQFFAKLESELEKVEAFYLDREGEVKEMYDAPHRIQMSGFHACDPTTRLIELKRQLQELQDHQKFFQVFRPCFMLIYPDREPSNSNRESKRCVRSHLVGREAARCSLRDSAVLRQTPGWRHRPARPLGFSPRVGSTLSNTDGPRRI